MKLGAVAALALVSALGLLSAGRTDAQLPYVTIIGTSEQKMAVLQALTARPDLWDVGTTLTTIRFVPKDSLGAASLDGSQVLGRGCPGTEYVGCNVGEILLAQESGSTLTTITAEHELVHFRLYQVCGSCTVHTAYNDATYFWPCFQSAALCPQPPNPLLSTDARG